MSRFMCGIFVFCFLALPLTTGCGDGGNAVIEETRSAEEIADEDAAYDAEMEAAEAADVGD